MCMKALFIIFSNITMQLAVQQIIREVTDHVFLTIDMAAILSSKTLVIDEEMLHRRSQWLYQHQDWKSRTRLSLQMKPFFDRPILMAKYINTDDVWSGALMLQG